MKSDSSNKNRNRHLAVRLFEIRLTRGTVQLQNQSWQLIMGESVWIFRMSWKSNSDLKQLKGSAEKKATCPKLSKKQ